MPPSCFVWLLPRSAFLPEFPSRFEALSPLLRCLTGGAAVSTGVACAVVELGFDSSGSSPGSADIACTASQVTALLRRACTSPDLGLLSKGQSTPTARWEVPNCTKVNSYRCMPVLGALNGITCDKF